MHLASTNGELIGASVPGSIPGTVPPVVEAQDINKKFGPTVALRDAHIRVEAGRTHALVGRNGAGKSTLVSILTGLRGPDTGWVKFNGLDAPDVNRPAEWQRNVACVYQHSTIIPYLTVAENLFINRLPMKHGLIDWKGVREQSQTLLEHWGVHVGVDTHAGDLNIEDRQLVEIARSLSRGARFVILDEPTAQLDGREIKRLFGRLEELQARGITFLFISHHLQEVYDICQDVTVFRDATHIITAKVDELPKNALIEAMTGMANTHALLDAADRQCRTDGQPIVEFDKVSSEVLSNVSLQVREGEIIGIAGGSSSGRTQLAEAVVGLSAFTGGTITIEGQPMRSLDVPRSLALKVGCVPKSRHREGLVLGQPIAENVSMPVFGELGRFGFISSKKKQSAALAAIERLDIHTSGPDQVVSDLSGGNQQKVVFARALSNKPSLLVLIDPTAGVDVKSKTSLLEQAEVLRQQGKAILLSSSEPEDLRICDRVFVMFHGEITKTYEAGWKEADLVASIEGLDR